MSALVEWLLKKKIKKIIKLKNILIN